MCTYDGSLCLNRLCGGLGLGRRFRLLLSNASGLLLGSLRRRGFLGFLGCCLLLLGSNASCLSLFFDDASGLDGLLFSDTLGLCLGLGLSSCGFLSSLGGRSFFRRNASNLSLGGGNARGLGLLCNDASSLRRSLCSSRFCSSLGGRGRFASNTSSLTRGSGSSLFSRKRNEAERLDRAQNGDTQGLGTGTGLTLAAVAFASPAAFTAA